MPRKPSKPSPLRTVREIAGLTQQQLATRVGVSKTAIQKMEAGTMTMSLQLANRLRSQLGCYTKRIPGTDGRGDLGDVLDKVLDDTGSWRPYAREDFLANEEMRRAIAEDIGLWSEQLAGALHMLLAASARSGQASSLVAEVEAVISGWMGSYALREAVRGMLRAEGMEGELVDRLADLLAVSPARAGLEYRRAKAQVEADGTGKA